MATIVGASESEVVIMNSLTVNLHLLMAAFYKPHGNKRKILMENHGFPSDTHALISQLEVHGFDPATDLICAGATGVEDWNADPSVIANQAIISTIERRSDEIAIVILPAVQFLSGQFFDIANIVKAAHAKHIIVGIDCAHAVGNVPLTLHD
uniref:Kynureninase 1 n=1 Tax=Lygus hesperus TaxID=30085 RepID=A0A0A9WPC6_LYGHE